MNAIIDQSGTITELAASIKLAMEAVSTEFHSLIGKSVRLHYATNGTELDDKDAKLGQIAFDAYTVSPSVMRKGILCSRHWGWLLERAQYRSGYPIAEDDVDLIEVGRYDTADDAAIGLVTHVINDMIYAKFNARAEEAFANQVAKEAKGSFLMSHKMFLEEFPEHTVDVVYIQEAHKGQKRHHGAPYFLHPIAVCEIGKQVANAEQIPYTTQLRRGFLYHDVVEDNPQIPWTDLIGLLGKDVVEWVKPVTKVKPADWKDLDHQTKLRWTIEHYRALRDAPIESRVIKVADRIHNLSEMAYSSFWFRQNYILDTAILIGAIKDTIRPETLALLKTVYWDAAGTLIDSV